MRAAVLWLNRSTGVVDLPPRQQRVGFMPRQRCRVGPFIFDWAECPASRTWAQESAAGAGSSIFIGGFERELDRGEPPPAGGTASGTCGSMWLNTAYASASTARSGSVSISTP